MSWLLNHVTPVGSILLLEYALVMGWRLATRLERDGWGDVPRQKMFQGYGTGVLVWLVYAISMPGGPMFWVFLMALTAIFVPSLMVIATRPDRPDALD